MKYDAGQKFDVKVPDGLMVEIIARFPAAQNMNIDGRGGDEYEIMINGFRTRMKEEILVLLVTEKRPSVPVEPKKEEKVAEVPVMPSKEEFNKTVKKETKKGKVK